MRWSQMLLEGVMLLFKWCSLISYTAKILKKVKKTKYFIKKKPSQWKNINRLGKLKKMRFRIANFLYYIE